MYVSFLYPFVPELNEQMGWDTGMHIKAQQMKVLLSIRGALNINELPGPPFLNSDYLDPSAPCSAHQKYYKYSNITTKKFSSMMVMTGERQRLNKEIHRRLERPCGCWEGRHRSSKKRMCTIMDADRKMRNCI